MGSHNVYTDLFTGLSDDALYSPSDLLRFAKSSEHWAAYCEQSGHSEEYVERKLVDALRKRMKRAFSGEQIVEYASSSSKRKTKGVSGKDWKNEFGISFDSERRTVLLSEETAVFLENLEKRVENFLLNQEKKMKAEEPSLVLNLPPKGKHLKVFEVSDDLTLDSLVASNKVWKSKYEELKEENLELRSKSPKSHFRKAIKKPLALFTSAIFVFALVAGFTNPSLFDIHQKEGAAAALDAVNQRSSKMALNEEEQYAKAYFLHEMEQVSEAESIARRLIASSTPRIKALGNHMLALVKWHKGEKKQSLNYFKKALSFDAIDGNTRAMIMLHLGKRTRNLEMIQDALSYLDPNEKGYWSFQTEYARARLQSASSVEEAKGWAIEGIEAAMMGQFPQKEAFFRKDLAIFQIAEGEDTVEHLLAQEIALTLKDRRIWIFTLVPEAMIAKRDGNDIRYHWIVETLESELDQNSSALLRANIKTIKNWSPKQ